MCTVCLDKVHMYVCMYDLILPIVATNVCFNQSSVSITEGQGLVMITAVITNLSAINVTIGVITTDITTTGKVNVIVTTNICM